MLARFLPKAFGGRTPNVLPQPIPSAEEASDDESEPDEKPNAKWGFKPDTGSGLMLASVRLLDPASVDDRGNGLSTSFVMVSAALHLFAMFAQFTLPVLLYAFPIEQSEDVFEGSSWQQHLQVLKKHLSADPPTQMDKYDPLESEVMKVCSHDHTVRFAQSALIIMWFLKLAPGIMQAVWVTIISMQMPIADDGEALVHVDGDTINIIRLTRGLQRFFLWGVNGPRTLILLFVAFVGAKFLLYANNMAALMLKIPPLFFLAQVDNVVFDGLASAAVQKRVCGAAFHYHQETIANHWHLYGASVTKAIAIAGLAFWYTHSCHAELQEWRDLCNQYENNFQPDCKRCGLKVLGTVFAH